MDVSASIAMANSREQGPWWERNVDLAAVAGGCDAKYGGRHFFGSGKYGFILEESVPISIFLKVIFFLFNKCFAAEQ